jgi:hypothetical protein
MNRRLGAAARLAVLIAVGMTVVEGSEQASPVEFRQSSKKIDVLIGGKLFTTYHFDSSVAKPYFQPLRSAQGTVVTRDFPNGNTVPEEHQKDKSLEPHQRPMYFGHGNVDGIDFWGEAVFPKWSDDTVFGRTVLKKIEEVRGGSNEGVLRATFDLVGPRGRVIAQQDQTYTFRGDSRMRSVDCEFTIKANQGSAVTMGDTKEGSFAVRVAQELNSPPGHIVNSEGARDEKVWGQRANWVDYYGKVNGEDAGVAIMDSPKSFRHPTYWHARTYGLAAANPFGIREFSNDPAKDGSWTIPQGETLVFRYRVVIHHGDYRQAGIAEMYKRYAAEQQ